MPVTIPPPEKIVRNNHSRWSSLDLGRGRITRNRVVVPAMASETADAEGFVTDKTLAHYRRLTQSGAGLINVEYTFVHRSGRSEPHQLGAATDNHLAGLSELARVIKSSGAVAGLQLVHSGGKTSRDLTGGVIMGPSAIAVPVKDRELEEPTPMTIDAIRGWQQDFVAATRRAVASGFDLVELHCAHGYGLNQWLSPLTNQRTDEYGGAHRVRILREIVRAIRGEFPDLLLAARLPGQYFIPGGLTVSDMIAMIKLLVSDGLDIIDISSGLGGWRRPSERTRQGYLVPEAVIIQQAFEQPVIGVGGIEDGAFIDELIQRGDLALAAVGRAILKDPFVWYQNNLQNKEMA